MSDIEYKGYIFKVTHVQDDTSMAPWEASDGHGPVREVYAPNGLRDANIKRPGERVLFRSRGHYLLYDWKAAAEQARKDGWSTEPHEDPHPLQRALQADFDYLKGWCDEVWTYIGVTVTLEDDPTFTDSLWGVESGGTYKDEVARELADEVLSLYLAKLALEKNEAAEVEYWASRDVVTGVPCIQAEYA